jgi:hypothetical protein
VYHPRAVTIAVVGYHRAMQYTANVTQFLMTAGSSAAPTGLALYCDKGKIGIWNNSEGKLSNLRSDSSPNFFGVCADATGCHAFRGEHYEAIAGGAFAAQTPATGMLTGGGSYGYGFFGDALEELIYQRKLDSTSTAELAAYYAALYSWPSSANRSKMLVVEGSSTAYGQGATLNRNFITRTTLAFRLQRTILNFASGGKVNADFASRFATTVGDSDLALGMADGYTKTLVGWWNANDLVATTGDMSGLGDDQDRVDVLTGYYMDRYAEAIAAGYRVIAVTIHRTDQYQTARNLYNDWLRNSAPKHALIDAQSLGLTLTDGIHTNDAGHQLLANALETAVATAESSGGARSRWNRNTRSR